MLPKEDRWGILKVSEVSHTEIKNAVNKFHDEWMLDTSRQETFTTHEHTFMYELMAFDYSWRPGQLKKSTLKNKLPEKAQKELENIYEILERYVNGKVMHAEIISMKPKSRVRTHKDRGDMLYLARRFHVPLKTSMEAFFTVDEEKYFLLEGFVYELNNTKYHSVRNNSNEYRIHLIIDVMPNEHADTIEFN